ncbi:hypothetical protein N7499_002653 [Penicillium canescens]|uniref:Uncharacterized protein n=1 Tax=Penicillium canescens TaxID=5083 RepID=A0AAD6I829_PENCN|nr:uncharacterized protein N7446_010265 [Penicillium canescens]KAJ6001432.1 hypothetical protein N7522_006659 [Penicillium canescens]KAJ6035502.1 hypothetical protein N7460_009677 [Penicillium canescens]KAJ6037625.1 hypothetical protein N7444_010330 [Penicillium canescens]KAJ6054253.1 hypothetical protein N7446_010265 [Penicillium canescens]KAJ6098279.1 hypothetical protein N7499_002653 [Penicillium canescens]
MVYRKSKRSKTECRGCDERSRDVAGAKTMSICEAGQTGALKNRHGGLMYATSAKVRAHERRIGTDRNATPSNRKVKSGPGHLAGARTQNATTRKLTKKPETEEKQV